MVDLSKYNPEGKSVRSVEEIRQGMLSHPDNAERQEELELLIDWRLARETHLNRHGKAVLQAFNEKMGPETSQTLRALTLMHELAGDETVFRTRNEFAEAMKTLFMQPAEKQIHVDLERLENIRLYPVASSLPVKNAIKFEGLTETFVQQAQGERDEAMDYIERNFVGSHNKPPTPYFC